MITTKGAAHQSKTTNKDAVFFFGQIHISRPVSGKHI